MFEILKVIILGIVEGITEWLPISSTGHMLLLYQLFSIDETEPFWSMFLVVIQFGAILAVILMYFKMLWPFQRPAEGTKGKEKFLSAVKNDKIVMWLKILVSCIPAVPPDQGHLMETGACDRPVPGPRHHSGDVQVRGDHTRRNPVRYVEKMRFRIHVLPGDPDDVRRFFAQDHQVYERRRGDDGNPGAVYSPWHDDFICGFDICDPVPHSLHPSARFQSVRNIQDRSWHRSAPVFCHQVNIYIKELS